MKKIIRVEQHQDDLMHLTWAINNICTNACSYCPSDLHSGTNHNYDWENARKFFKILFEKYPAIHCSVSGGEASVSPFFKEIVEIFHNAGHTIGATSNAAKPVKYWEDISPLLNYICFSYHPEFPDKNFIDKIKVAAPNTFVAVRIMMHPDYWDQCINMYYECAEIPNINTESVRIFDWGGANRTAHVYTPEQLVWLENNAGTDKKLPHLYERVKVPRINANLHFDDNTVDQLPNTVDYINKGMTNFNGYICEVGLKSLFIESSGKVYLGNCMINGSIGNINDPENIKWPTSSVICNKNLCHCTSDVNINKRII